MRPTILLTLTLTLLLACCATYAPSRAPDAAVPTDAAARPAPDASAFAAAEAPAPPAPQPQPLRLDFPVGCPGPDGKPGPGYVAHQKLERIDEQRARISRDPLPVECVVFTVPTILEAARAQGLAPCQVLSPVACLAALRAAPGWVVREVVPQAEQPAAAPATAPAAATTPAQTPAAPEVKP